MKRNAMFLAAGAIAAGLLAAGCGGNDDSSSDTGTDAAALTKEEYLAEGNAICAQGNAEIDAAAEALGQNPTPEQIQAFASDTLVPNVQGQIDDLRNLGAPEGDEETLNAIYDEAESILDGLVANPSLATQGEDPFTSINPKLTEYGLTECAGGS